MPLKLLRKSIPARARDEVRIVFELHGLEAALHRGDMLGIRPGMVARWLWSDIQTGLREAVQ